MTERIAEMHIAFLDGTCLAVQGPRMVDEAKGTIAAVVRRMLEQEKLVIEADGDLIVVPMSAIRQITVTPAPKELPGNVIRGARRVAAK